MKAKFIYENLDFERGKDPYDTLDIGRDKDKRKLISAAKQYADENIPIPYYPKESYFEEFADTTLSRIGPEFRLEWVLEDIGGWWEEWEEDKGLRVDEAQNFERGKDPKKAIGLGIPPEKIFNLGGAKKLPRGVEMSPARSAFGRYSDEEVKELLEDPVGYNNKTQGTIWLIGAGPGYRFFSVDYIIQKQKEFEYIEYDDQIYPINPVKESLDFERGEDPKDSLRIGRNYTDVAHVKDIVDGNGKSISHPMDLRTFFGNIEMGLYPGNFYIVLDGNGSFFSSDELPKRGYKKLLFKDKMHVLG